MNKTPHGFTLIELMITVVILGTLAAIAYPAYQDRVEKARRADAQAALLELSTLMEGYYTENNTYVGAATPADVGGSATSAKRYYNLSITNLTASTYTLNAAPDAGGPQASDSCGTLTLTHTNIKGPKPATCWQ